MGKSDETLGILKRMARKNGKILPLSMIHRTLIKEGILSSKRAVANVLRRLEMVKKIRTVNFGVSVELLENEEYEKVEQKKTVQPVGHRQSLLNVFRKVV